MDGVTCKIYSTHVVIEYILNLHKLLILKSVNRKINLINTKLGSSQIE